jgi:predicted RNase H-like nuclease (RuvC/YqgF family)
MNPILEAKIQRLESLIHESDQEIEQLEASATTIQQKLCENKYRKVRLLAEYHDATLQLSIPMLNLQGAY